MLYIKVMEVRKFMIVFIKHDFEASASGWKVRWLVCPHNYVIGYMFIFVCCTVDYVVLLHVQQQLNVSLAFTGI